MKNFRKIFAVALFFAVIGIVSILNVPQAKATIVASSITVLSPNGGEQYPIGSTQTIKWTNNGLLPTDFLYISLYNENLLSSTSQPMSLFTVNDGNENWIVPNSLVPGDKYRIEIKKADNSFISDKGDAVFSIVVLSTTLPIPSIINSLPQTAKVLFTAGANLGERRREIYALDIDNGVTTKITTSNKHHVITGIDNSRRYIVSSQTEKDTNKPDGLGDEDKRNLWIIDLETKKETRLTNIENNAEGDSFSPDGNWIVFMMTISGEEQPDIYKIKKDGTELTKLTDTKTVIEGDPEFSHDGKKIVFTSLDTSDANPRSIIKIMDSNGQNIQTVYDGGNGVRVGSFSQGNYDPSWGPDDGWIVFERATAATEGNWGSGIWHIFKVKQDGSGIIDLSEKGGHKDASEYLPSFSPDGKSIIFGSLFFNAVKPEQSYNSIFLMDANSGLAKRLTIDPTGVGDMYPVFIPNIIPNQPSITVLSPNGGEVWQAGKAYKIKWSTNNISTDKKISIGLLRADRIGELGVSDVISIVKNINNTGSYNWTVPISITPAKYVIETYTTEWIEGRGSDTSDAQFSIVATSTLPDLTISDLSTSVESGKTYLKIKINNSGATTTNGQIISVKAEDLETGDIYTSGYSNSLKGVKEILSSKPLVMKNSAAYKLKATIDYTNLIDESNENNNIFEKAITISKPDLIVKSITENTANNLINVVIKNIGTSSADITNSIVRVIYGSNYYNKIENCNPDNIACLTVNRKRVDEYNAGINAGFLHKEILAPKEEYSILFNKPNYLLQDINFKPGKLYLIKAYVDFNNGVAEINERNNSLSKIVRVVRVLSVKLRKK